MRTHQAPQARRHRLLRWRRRVSPRPRQACHRRAPPSEERSIPTRATTCAAPLSSYTLDFRFPVDYPDQQALTDTLTQERDQFVGWVAQAVPRPYPYELDVVGKAYHLGTPASGTQSLVLDIGSDTGAHPLATYKALNYDLGKHAPLTFDTLFKPGTQPLDVLNPIVQRQLDKHGATGALSLDDLGTKAYQNFAITDDAVMFFFNQDGLLPHEDGPLHVDVPRTNIASLLA
ncbi:MAG: hypothetical protein QOC69_5772 [Mycobacterium sp.]|nr:hypothetical protein [Mycobacterium sp.]